MLFPNFVDNYIGQLIYKGHSNQDLSKIRYRYIKRNFSSCLKAAVWKGVYYKLSFFIFLNCHILLNFYLTLENYLNEHIPRKKIIKIRIPLNASIGVRIQLIKNWQFLEHILIFIFFLKVADIHINISLESIRIVKKFDWTFYMSLFSIS